MQSQPCDDSTIHYTIKSSNEIVGDFINNRHMFSAITNVPESINNIKVGEYCILHRKANDIYYICRVYSKNDVEIMLCFCGNMVNNKINIFKNKKEFYYIGYKYFTHCNEIEFEDWDMYEQIEIYCSIKDYKKLKLFNKKYSEDDSNIECPICSNCLSENENISITGCNHAFHESCINKWFDIKTTCPTCRTVCYI